jgi:hypothetical protein
MEKGWAPSDWPLVGSREFAPDLSDLDMGQTRQISFFYHTKDSFVQVCIQCFCCAVTLDYGEINRSTSGML